jgi:hypothetical protein
VGSYLTVRPSVQPGLLSRFLFKSGDPVSVGASGALFGLIGVLFIFGIKFRHELPDDFKRAFGTGMLPTILLNVFIGFTIPVIDNAAHMGGLIAGAALALVVGYKRPGERASVAIFWHVLQVAALCLVVLSFTMVVLRYQGPRPSLNNLSSRSLLNTGESDAPAFLNALNGGQQALSAAIEDKLEQNDFESAVKALEAAPRLDDRAGELLDELKALITRAQEIPRSPASAKAKMAAIEQKRKVIKDAEAWIKKRDQWVETEGEKHGIKLSKPPAATENQNEEQPRPPEEQQQRPAQKQRNQK